MVGNTKKIAEVLVETANRNHQNQTDIDNATKFRTNIIKLIQL